MSGAKIIKALEEAERGDFSRVTVAGHVWIRDGVDKAAAWDAISEKNVEIERLRAALKEAERFMSYFANETGGHFIGAGTPENCLAQIRAALWVEKPSNPPPGLTEHELDRDEALDSIGWFGPAKCNCGNDGTSGHDLSCPAILNDGA